ncbi:serine/threonine protein kinase [Gordonia jinghuaiqii]|uniref:Serine/threonine protein kinase n=1 Tax=Gordonia jinghuaiqii TaxID=2758710 RepID=A0A7D7QFJ3_9ACTN|nr:serine/threonine protein kinase [Gordonia jinghuaiqii]MCR5976455.1 serine/threonine protein kinase [Gordonia jinghuaiqii]QMS99661.1 serine/threonine protein kinase [Gordonia jinghuaiqii]
MNRSEILSTTVAWPTCALGAWSAAWIAGRCSPDDVISALAESADRHEVHRRNEVHERNDGRAAAQELSPPTGSANGALDLLGLLRSADALVVRLPSTGDPQGLPPHPATSAALVAGEVLLVERREADAGGTLALIPELVTQAADPPHVTCRWSVFRYDTTLDLGHLVSAGPTAGDLEYQLQQAVRDAARIIGGLGGRRSTDATDLRVQLAGLTARHRVSLPSHARDARSTRLIDTAAQVEAIVDLAGARRVEIGDSAGQWDSGDSTLRGLQILTRSARAAAVNHTILELLRR